MRLPLVAVMVSVYVPVGVLVLVLIVRVDEVPEPVIVCGLNEAVAPEGRPETLRPMVPVNPFTRVMATV